ncbi:lysozyme inhibitor LprI family protein [Sphingomonas sp. GB1N7]|uniref:lysozyme inhibitor LprI family protein n=1 Tax=Parasphingomonas caseinilytica TaxID=3096158 RepID=UPI002FCAF434
MANHDVQRLPFDSTISTIRTCLRQSEDTIQMCLDAGSSEQLCETDASQCSYAAEQAWQLYIAHYLRLLRKRVAYATPESSQKAWAAYVDAECEFESALYPDDAPMRHVVDGTCRATKAQERALELRDSLINTDR